MLAMLALCWAMSASAQDGAPARQALDAVRLAAEDFLRRETQGLPGMVMLEVNRPDDRVSLAPCAQMTAFFPAGSRAWGRTTVGVRCTAQTPWTLYMAARVRIRAEYFETARALAAGQQVTEADLVRRRGDIDELPPGVVTEPSQAVGRRLANSLRAGTPLRADVLREPPAIQQGQLVGLVIAGPGFRVSSEGHSLGRAAEGKVVQVKTSSGAVVSGVVRPGPLVEILR
jgi:flagella basal body P-ring formation protein FlgA